MVSKSDEVHPAFGLLRSISIRMVLTDLDPITLVYYHVCLCQDLINHDHNFLAERDTTRRTTLDRL